LSATPNGKNHIR